MSASTQENNAYYLEKIDQVITKLENVKKVIATETYGSNPYIKGKTPEEVFNYVIDNLDNPVNNQDGGGKKSKRRSTQKTKNKKKQKNKKTKIIL
jgi:hypothetical protein